MRLRSQLPEARPAPFATPAGALLAAVAGNVLAGVGIARLTIGLNPHLRESLSDTLLLLLYFVAAYGLVGLAAGGAGAAAVAALRCLPGPERFRRLLAGAVVSVLLLTPVTYYLLLPGVGSGSALLTDALTAGRAGQALYLALAATILATLGWALGRGLGRISRRLGTSVRVLVAGGWLVWTLGLVLAALAVRPPSDGAAAGAAAPPQLPPPRDPPPPRVVLLCIDGADLDDVVEPMVAAGRLPTFAALMRDGTWGPLATIEPTLSAVVWTTIITGKPPAEHGIRHFLYFRLPGMGRPIYEFPLHSGLNYQLFPRLEKIPGLPAMRKPFTSNMRRAAALWTIIGRWYRVGSYRWLISWPAEKLNGFSVSGGVGWIRDSHAGRGRLGRRAVPRAVQPPDLLRDLPLPPPRPVTREDLEAYVGAGIEIPRDDRRLRPIVKSFRDATAHDLPLLIAKLDARFAAASFYEVDAFHHYFNRYRNRGGIFSDAIAERYRFTDARLGELLAALGEETHVLVVSDHGFDFEHDHHTHAPAGIFFARGPAFAPGRRVAGLGVYDLAPMVLHLLDLPLPDDMAGARSGNYRQALSRDFLRTHPVSRIATYETAPATHGELIDDPLEEETREMLRTLGYIQ